MVAETGMDNAVAEFTSQVYRVITSLRLPVASVAFFDTRHEARVVTEIIGLREGGTEFVQRLKYGSPLNAAD